MNKLHFLTKYNSLFKWLLLLSLTVFSVVALAGDAGGGGKSIKDIATNVTGSFEALGKLFIAIAFLGGIGFVMAAIFKFKQHKDNPTQIPLGTPIAMLVIGIVLIFLPNLIGPAGESIFQGGKVGGFRGEGTSVIPGAGTGGGGGT